MKDCSPSYQKHAWNYIYRWFDEATWSFSLYFKQIVGEEHFLFLSKLFWNNFQSSLDLERKRNPAILSSDKKALEIRENKAAIVPDINNHLTAGYDRKVYIGNVLGIDDSSAKVSFHEHAGNLGWLRKRPSCKCSKRFKWNQSRKKNWTFCARKCDGKILCMEE